MDVEGARANHHYAQERLENKYAEDEQRNLRSDKAEDWQRVPGPPRRDPSSVGVGGPLRLTNTATIGGLEGLLTGSNGNSKLPAGHCSDKEREIRWQLRLLIHQHTPTSGITLRILGIHSWRARKRSRGRHDGSDGRGRDDGALVILPFRSYGYGASYLLEVYAKHQGRRASFT